MCRIKNAEILPRVIKPLQVALGVLLFLSWSSAPAWASDSVGEVYQLQAGSTQSTQTTISPLIASIVYLDGLWYPIVEQQQRKQFASRGQWMSGGSSQALMDFISSVQEGMRTRRYVEKVDYENPQTVVGSMENAVVVKGGSATNYITAKGGLHIGATAFDRAKYPGVDVEKDHEGDEDYYRMYSLQPHGIEVLSWVGRAITRVNRDDELLPPTSPYRYDPESTRTDPVYNTVVDARANTYHEDDMWDMAPAIVKFQFGTLNRVLLDNADTDAGNKINTAIGSHLGVLSTLADSYLNSSTREIYKQYGTWVAGLNTNYLDSGPFERWAFCPDGSSEETTTERVGSTIEDSIRYEVKHPNWGGTLVGGRANPGAATGVFIADQQPDKAGGNPIEVASLVNPSLSGQGAIATERFTGIINRGDTILGNAAPQDSTARAFPRDVTPAVHVKDLLHLRPIETPNDTELLQLAGGNGAFLYFDALENRPVLVSLEGSTLENPVATLYPLQVKNGSLKDSNVVNFNGPATVTGADIARAAGDEYGSRWGARKYIGKKVIPDPNYSESGEVSGLNLTVTGFTKVGREALDDVDVFDIYWKRVGHGIDRWGETKWEALSYPGDWTGSYTAAPSEVVPISVDLKADAIDRFKHAQGEDGHMAYPRDIIQIMLIDKTTEEAAGTSIYVSDIGLAWREDFNLPDGTTKDTGPTDWSTSPENAGTVSDQRLALALTSAGSVFWSPASGVPLAGAEGGRLVFSFDLSASRDMDDGDAVTLAVFCSKSEDQSPAIPQTVEISMLPAGGIKEVQLDVSHAYFGSDRPTQILFSNIWLQCASGENVDDITYFIDNVAVRYYPPH